MTRMTLLSLLAGFLGMLAVPASAQYPESTVTIVVGANPGASGDLLARMLAEKLTEKWGRTVQVLNRSGGSGLLSAAEVAKAREVMQGSKLAPRMETMEQVYARETVLLSGFPKEVSAPLQVVKIGAFKIAAMPAEVFVEIGLELKNRHPGTTVVSLANAYHGYLPTPEHHALGGYETWRARSSYLEVEASTKMVKALNEMIAEFE